MNKKIDLSEIAKELDDKVKRGIDEGRLDITDISRLIGEHIEKAKEKIMKDVGEIASERVRPEESDICQKCGGALKKTKKRTKK